MSKLTEHTIREACRARLDRQFASDDSTLIIEEFGVLGGQRRVDVAAINGHFHGFEIKSDLDNLKRLAGQSEKYGLVFDYLTVICSEKYLASADEILPKHWGLLRARQTKQGHVATNYIRRPKINRETDSAFVFHLLWKEEMVSVLTEFGAPASVRCASKQAMAEYVSRNISKSKVSELVRGKLKVREGWRHPPPSS
jgi:hypothetical protein